jgi:hypothetical protein
LVWWTPLAFKCPNEALTRRLAHHLAALDDEWLRHPAMGSSRLFRQVVARNAEGHGGWAYRVDAERLEDDFDLTREGHDRREDRAQDQS